MPPHAEAHDLTRPQHHPDERTPPDEGSRPEYHGAQQSPLPGGEGRVPGHPDGHTGGEKGQPSQKADTQPACQGDPSTAIRTVAPRPLYEGVPGPYQASSPAPHNPVAMFITL